MFINDLPENLTSDTRLFDDDAIVYCQIHSVEDKVILQNASKTSRMGTTMGHESSPTKIQLPQNLHIQNTKNIQIHYKICHPSRWNFNEIPWRNLRSVYNNKFGMSVMTNVNEHDISNCVTWHVAFDKRGTVDEQNDKNQRCTFL